MPSNKASARIEHLASPNGERATPLIADVIRVLVPSGSHAELVALFEHRTTIDTIRQWRHGRRPAPQWALDICARRLAPIAQLAERARTAPSAGHGGLAGARTLAAWRAAQKEKARNGAGS